MAQHQNPQSFLPLTPAVFHILLALVECDRHGYGIAREVAARTTEQVRLGPGTLYGTLGRMLDAGLVEERGASRAAKDAPSERSRMSRRRYYRVTPLGRQVARAEAARLNLLVALARAKDLIPAR